MKGKTKRYGKVFMSLILALGMIFGNISAVLAADYSLGSGIKTGDSKQLQSGDKITAGSDSVFQVVQNGKVVYPSEGAIKGYEDEAQTKESGRSYGKGSYTLPAAESGKVWKAAAAQNKDWFYDEANAKMRQGAYVITLEQMAEPKEQPKEEPKEQPKEEQQAPPVKAAVDAETPVITGNPAAATYDKDAPAAALSVTASVSEGTLSYQWYQSTDAGSDGTPVGGNANSYTPETGTVGTTYYYCVVTNTNTNVAGAQTATAESGRAAITVNDTAPIINAATPDITADPVDAAYDKDETANPLSVTATVTDGGTLSYQWYQSADADSDGTAIQRATNSEYTPGTGTVGTTYYYCVVTNTNDAVTGEKTATAASARARITVNDNQPAAPQTPQFTGHPQSKDYEKGDTAIPLSVTAEVTDGGALSYQWYQNTSNDITTGTKIEGATEKQYTPKTDKAGTVYYYCIVTNTKDQKTASASSNAAKIVVTDTQKTDAKAPKITGNPKGASYFTDAAAKALQVKAESLDGGKLSYQWYSNTKNSTKDGTAVKDATESTYTPSTKKNGTVYYYCVVTNTNKELNGNQTATAVSDTAKIVVSTRKNAETPSVSGPNNATYYKGKAAKAMEVKASVKDGGTLSYQWYSNTKNSTKDGSVIKDATKSTYTPSTASVGTTYYYCVVTNTNNSVNGDQAVSITSRAAKITVKASTSKASPVKRTLNTKSTRAANAKTGDETNLMLWIALLAAAGIVIAVLAVRIKRNRK